MQHRRRIVYTRPDGGVNVYEPSLSHMAWLSCGCSFWQGRGFAERQIESQMQRGVLEFAARAYARAMVQGGCSTGEALAILRDRDCAHLGTAHELWDIADLPGDRWFRDAWRRSANGGPIELDLSKARRIQFARIKSAADKEAKRRSTDLDAFDRPVQLPWGNLRDRIHAASEVSDLRRVWPEELN